MNRNTSKSNDSWIYIDGELYHAGIKGMKWGKHLPGTDWWKPVSGRKSNNIVNIKNSSPYVSPEYQKEVEFNSQQNKYPKDKIDSINKRKRISSKTDQAANKISSANRSGSSVFDTGSRRDNMQKRKKNPGLVERATNAVRAYGASIKVSAKSLVKNLSNRISYCAYKAKKIASKFANKTVSAIKTTANKYQGKVKDFLRNIGLYDVKPQKILDNKRRGGFAGKSSNDMSNKFGSSSNSRSNSSNTRVDPNLRLRVTSKSGSTSYSKQ